MTYTTARLTTIALAVLAIAAPAASAMPIRDNGVQTPSRSGTSLTPTQNVRNADNRVPAQRPRTTKPVVTGTQPAPVKDDGPSPLVFILPSLALIAMLAAATVYVRRSRQPART
jgi:hypothetical protein